MARPVQLVIAVRATKAHFSRDGERSRDDSNREY
jgi:hypothetical protein